MIVADEVDAVGRAESSTARRTSGLAMLAGRLGLAIWGSPVGAGIAAAIAYTALASIFAPSHLGQSRYPYFIYLADAFLHGQLALVGLPPAGTHDLSFYQGRYYLYWPPFPAVLFMPLVAAFGVGISDAPLTLAIGGLNVALVSLLLAALDERKVISLSLEKRACLTAFFALGTVHLTLAPYARVWFTAQVISFALLCGAYLVALRVPPRWAPLVSGTLVACAFLTRNAMLFAAIWIAWHLLRERDRRDRFAVARIAFGGLLPVGLAVALLAGYNYFRFGSVLETGLSYQKMAGLFLQDFQRYGALSLHYLPTNLFYDFVAFPYLTYFKEGLRGDFWMGGSIFLMSPVFLLAIPGVLRLWGTHGWALALSFGAGMVPILLLMGTGWVQFGPRYTLDVTVPLLVATAVGAAFVPTRFLAWLCIASFAIYLPGAIWLSIAL